jgi:hypothetical protein
VIIPSVMSLHGLLEKCPGIYTRSQAKYQGWSPGNSSDTEFRRECVAFLGLAAYGWGCQSPKWTCGVCLEDFQRGYRSADCNAATLAILERDLFAS